MKELTILGKNICHLWLLIYGAKIKWNLVLFFCILLHYMKIPFITDMVLSLWGNFMLSRPKESICPVHESKQDDLRIVMFATEPGVAPQIKFWGC